MIEIVKEDSTVKMLRELPLSRGAFGGHPVKKGMVSTTITLDDLDLDGKQSPEEMAAKILKIAEAGWTQVELFDERDYMVPWFSLSRPATEEEKIDWECFLQQHEARQEAKDRKLYERLKKRFNSDKDA